MDRCRRPAVHRRRAVLHLEVETLHPRHLAPVRAGRRGLPFRRGAQPGRRPRLILISSGVAPGATCPLTSFSWAQLSSREPVCASPRSSSLPLAFSSTLASSSPPISFSARLFSSWLVSLASLAIGFPAADR